MMLLAVSWLLSACGRLASPTPAGSPRVTAKAWAESVRRENPDSSRALLSARASSELARGDLSLRWRDTQQERAAQADQVERAVEGPGGIREWATVTLGDGKTVSLVREEAGWRIEAPLLSSLHASGPEDALRFLASALETRNFDALVRILTSRRREGLHQALDSFIKGLKEHAPGEVEISGDRAFLRWSDGRLRWKVTLLREAGEWRIDDVDLQ